jgi:hypothetical protein
MTSVRTSSYPAGLKHGLPACLCDRHFEKTSLPICCICLQTSSRNWPDKYWPGCCGLQTPLSCGQEAVPGWELDPVQCLLREYYAHLQGRQVSLPLSLSPSLCVIVCVCESPEHCTKYSLSLEPELPVLTSKTSLDFEKFSITFYGKLDLQKFWENFKYSQQTNKKMGQCNPKWSVKIY